MPEFDKEQLNPEELQVPQLTTTPVDPMADIQDVSGASEEDLEKLKQELQETLDELDAEDLDKRNYVKVSPTFYIQSVKNEDEEDETELFKILNPVEGTVETRELTDDEKKELLVAQLKQSRQKFQPLSHPTKVVGKTAVDHPFLKDKDGNPIQRMIKEREYQTNKTVNKYGSAYKAKRKRKNKMAKVSRKANR